MTATEIHLVVQRTIAATPEAVFDAWTTPAVLRRWFAAGPDWDTPVADVDLRPGGAFRIAMRNPQTGDVHAATGEYVEIDRPRRLVHAGFAHDGIRDLHVEGWQGTLANLAGRAFATDAS